MDYEVPLQSAAGRCGGTNPGLDPADLSGAGGRDFAGGGLAGPRPYSGVGAAAFVAVEAGAICQGEVVAAAPGGVSEAA